LRTTWSTDFLGRLFCRNFRLSIQAKEWRREKSKNKSANDEISTKDSRDEESASWTFPEGRSIRSPESGVDPTPETAIIVATMNESSEYPAPQNVDVARVRFSVDLDSRRFEINRLVARILGTRDIHSKRLKKFITDATKIHESFCVMWDKLQSQPEIHATLVEPTARASQRLLNLEDRLSTLHEKLLGEPYQFPAFPGLSQVQQNEEQGNRNPPLPKPSQGPASPSSSQSEVIQTEDEESRHPGNSI
jgi:hypothetical protein